MQHVRQQTPRGVDQPQRLPLLCGGIACLGVAVALLGWGAFEAATYGLAGLLRTLVILAVGGWYLGAGIGSVRDGLAVRR